MKFITVFLALSLPAMADSKISLDQYLQQVKAGSPRGRALTEDLSAAQLALVQAESSITTEVYGEAGISDDQSEKLISFMGRRTEGHGWKLGLRKQFTTGTMANLYYDSRWANITGAAGIQTPNYYENKAVLELVQPLWRNGFGAETRASVDLKRAEVDANLAKARFELKKMMMDAENIYWSLVTYNEVIKLQQENVERSRKLRDNMKNKAGLRLVDDVEYLQAQASLETRELELQNSLDERANLIRDFNLIRGVASEEVESLDPLPEKLLKEKFKPNKKVTREDYEEMRKRIEMSRAAARGGISHVQPQFDLVGNFSANGMDPQSNRASDEVFKNEHEAWMVGVRFSAPLDYSLMHKMANSFRAQKRSAAENAAYLDFNIERSYSKLVNQHEEAQRRYEKAQNLEKVTTQLVKQERQRLLNGRSTTFQSLTIEQNLAASQITKVQAQLALVKIHNVLKTFEEAP